MILVPVHSVSGNADELKRRFVCLVSGSHAAMLGVIPADVVPTVFQKAGLGNPPGTIRKGGAVPLDSKRAQSIIPRKLDGPFGNFFQPHPSDDRDRLL